MECTLLGKAVPEMAYLRPVKRKTLTRSLTAYINHDVWMYQWDLFCV